MLHIVIIKPLSVSTTTATTSPAHYHNRPQRICPYTLVDSGASEGHVPSANMEQTQVEPCKFP